MALRADLLTRIRNIHWGGGATFVVKSLTSQLLRGRVPSAGNVSDWKSLGDPAPFEIFGGAFGNSGSSSFLFTSGPVFVVSALHQNEESDEGSALLASRDGTTWKMVWSEYTVSSGEYRSPWILQPTGIVWDRVERAFFASFYQVDWDAREVDSTGTIFGPDGELIMRSSDGFNWTEYYRQTSLDGLDDDSPSQLDSHCNKPENEGGIPDGLQAWEESTQTFMKPQSLTSFSPVNGAIYGVGVGDLVTNRVTIRHKGVTTTRSVSAPCYAVAQYNGIWSAVGGETGTNTSEGLIGAYLSIDISSDGGNEWQQVYKEDFKQNESQNSGRPAGTVSASRYIPEPKPSP